MKLQPKKISEYEWEIPKQEDMNVPGKILANKKLIKEISNDWTLQQITNVAKLPGIQQASMAMPDAHQGYGFPVGGVAAFNKKTGVICPGGVGYDINCSVRLIHTNLQKKDIKGKEKEILQKLHETIPTGVGEGNILNITKKELNEILQEGAEWMIQKGYGNKKDLEYIEENGKMKGANEKLVSETAKKKRTKTTRKPRSRKPLLRHTRNRQNIQRRNSKNLRAKKRKPRNNDTLRKQRTRTPNSNRLHTKNEKRKKYGTRKKRISTRTNTIKTRKRIPSSNESSSKLRIRKQTTNRLQNKRNTTNILQKKFKANIVYDICHNIAKEETHTIKGKKQEVLIIRKGATRSFGPGRKEICKQYQNTGSPILLPGSMGTPSYILQGTKKAEETSLASTAHGAGRHKSRTNMRQKLTYKEAVADMEKRGIHVKSKSQKGMIEENPEAYKDITEVVKTSHELGIGKKVAKLQPLLVLIG